jgi:hypothetical protein
MAGVGAGPTNSGKTYTALQALGAAKSGVYCGPLRLLANEVYETLNADGVYCSLATGVGWCPTPFPHCSRGLWAYCLLTPAARTDRLPLHCGIVA